ncbi:MAG: energy transducer TonB [Terracidiphilus sp.]
MSLLILRRVRTFGMRPSVWLSLCFCLFILPAVSAQTFSGKAVRANSGQVTIPGDIAVGMLLEKNNPVYPPIAKAARVSGTVVLQAAISKTGTIEGLHVVSGPAMLQQAAFDAVKTWRYRPYLLQGVPVQVLTTVNVIFSLGGMDAPLKTAPSDSASPAADAQGSSHATSSVESQGDTPATSSYASFHTGMSEFAAWEVANKNGSPEVYREFYQRYPNSSQLKTATGTLRARYWFKVAQPFGDDGKHRDGVIVTFEGLDAGVNLTLEKAKKLKVIGFTPSSDTADSDSSGRTFNRTYFEATSGGVLVGNEMITPKDSLNAMVILSADGSRLLSWDITNATTSDHPSTQPTMIADGDGKFSCGDACPLPKDY